MKKHPRIPQILTAAALTTGLLSGCSTQTENSSNPAVSEEPAAYNPAGLIDYMENNPTTWMSVDNGYWSEDPQDQPTEEELIQMLDTAMKAQLAVQYSEVFCVVLTDYQDQFDVIGDYWDHSGKAVGKSVTEGTVTVLFYADKILPQEDHASEYGVYLDSTTGEESSYGSYYQPAASSAYMDTGITIAWLQFAAHALGYNTHIFGGLYGEAALNNPTQYIDGKNLMRGWGFPHEYGEDIKDIPLEGNVQLVAAVVIGKVAEGVDATTAASMHMRPSNYTFYDGVPGTPSSSDDSEDQNSDAQSSATAQTTEDDAASSATPTEETE